MYGQIPYIFPNTIMQGAPSTLNGLTNIGNLNNALGATRTGAGALLSKVNWSSLLSNAQKTLNVVNQAIPLYYQAKPVFKNIRTLGKIGKEFTKMGSDSNQNFSKNVIEQKEALKAEENVAILENIPKPTFFL